MENVVYVLGAGFSAPLGLPVMSNFLEKANNLYQTNKNEYPHFKRVFQSIKEKLAYVTLFYHTDLDNIEEVLSILEMEHLAGNVSQEQTDEFIKFIVDVIEYFTSPVEGLKNVNRKSKGVYQSASKITEWEITRNVISENLQESYGKFVLKLFNAELEIIGIEGENPDTRKSTEKKYNEFVIKCRYHKISPVKYSVVTLNYDLVLENLAEYYSSIIHEDEIRFSRPQAIMHENFPYLAKLHGSLDNDTIIPPTWNKTIQEKIILEWRTAYKLLSSANHIRILGYSLPENDAYVKYLLKSSLLESENLKTIDVVCMDNNNIVRRRYDSFISRKYPKYRFINGDLKMYLGWVSGNNRSLENGHEDFIREMESKASASQIG